MVVLHDLIHSSRVHQYFVGGVQVSFLLASRSVINSPYSFEVEFCISSFFSAIQSFSIVVGYHLIIFEMLSISPQQAYSFVVEFPTTPFNVFLLRMLSISFMVEVVIFFPVLFIPLFQVFRRFCVVPQVKYRSISQVHVLFFPCSVGVLHKFLRYYSFSILS